MVIISFQNAVKRLQDIITPLSVKARVYSVLEVLNLLTMSKNWYERIQMRVITEMTELCGDVGDEDNLKLMSLHAAARRISGEDGFYPERASDGSHKNIMADSFTMVQPVGRL